MTSRNNTSRNYDNNPPPSLRAPNPQNPPPVRRNIFSSHPRRPAATSSLSTATSSASQNVHSDASVSAKEGIIIRDEAGDFRLELPAPGLPPMREDQKEDYSAENRLIEQYYTHRHQIDITALHQLLTQKLHNNVLSLDEDKWMFGEEDGPTS